MKLWRGMFIGSLVSLPMWAAMIWGARWLTT
jgi:hypothetical protein